MASKTQETQIFAKERTPTGALQAVQQNIKPAQAFFTKFNNDWVMNLAAALAYNLLMAIFPIAIAVLSVLGYILGRLDPTAIANLINSIHNIFPSSLSASVVQNIREQLARASGLLGIIAIVLAIFNGSRLFVLIEGCFGIIYHVRQRSIIGQNLMAFAMLLLFVVLLPIMVFASTGPALVFSILKQTPLNNIPGSGLVFSLGGILGGLLASWLLFEAIYIVVPNQHISFRNSWLGSVVAAIALELYLALFPFYVSHFLKGFVGPAGFAVILLIFFYYFAVILLVGAEINAFFAEGVQDTPTDLVTMVHIVTSHLPKSQEDRELQAAASHKDAPTGDIAAQIHIVDTISPGNGKPNTVIGQNHQQLLSAPPSRHEQDQTRRDRPKSTSSKVGFALSAIAGTGLAFIVELFFRRKR